MQEYSIKAIVLERAPLREHDTRVTLFTKELGLIDGRATSAQKIISKLSAHLEPLTLAHVRLSHKNNFQITDALEIVKLEKNTHNIQSAQLIKRFFYSLHPEPQLWNAIEDAASHNKNIPVRSVLSVLGLEPELSYCQFCSSQNPSHFMAQESIYSCAKCLPDTEFVRALSIA